MVGVLVGAIIGRVLPAVLVSAVVIGLVFAGLSLAHDRWNRAEATVQPRYLEAAAPSEVEMTALGVAYGIETADGQFMSYGEAFDRGLDDNFRGEDGKVYQSEADLAAGRSIGMTRGSRSPASGIRSWCVVTQWSRSSPAWWRSPRLPPS